MKIIKKHFLTAVTIILAVFFFSTVGNFDNDKEFDVIVTFLSISTGFAVTGLSIIATSNFSKQLYQMEDAKDNSKTLLHKLVDEFKSSFFLFITTIGIILLYKYLPSFSEELFSVSDYCVTITSLVKAIIWTLTFGCLFYFFLLFRLFSKFVIKSAQS